MICKNYSTKKHSEKFQYRIECENKNYSNYSYFDGMLSKDIADWLYEHIGEGEYYTKGIVPHYRTPVEDSLKYIWWPFERAAIGSRCIIMFAFKKEEDAMLFKLVWG